MRNEENKTETPRNTQEESSFVTRCRNTENRLLVKMSVQVTEWRSFVIFQFNMKKFPWRKLYTVQRSIYWNHPYARRTIYTLVMFQHLQRHIDDVQIYRSYSSLFPYDGTVLLNAANNLKAWKLWCVKASIVLCRSDNAAHITYILVKYKGFISW